MVKQKFFHFDLAEKSLKVVIYEILDFTALRSKWKKTFQEEVNIFLDAQFLSMTMGLPRRFSSQ